MTEATLRRAWIAGLLMLVAFIVYASLSPRPVVSAATFSDKLGHGLAYFLLALLGSGIAAPERLWRTMLRCLVLGAAIEVAQGLATEHRMAEWADLGADAAGIAAAWLVAGQGRAGWAYRALGWLKGRQAT